MKMVFLFFLTLAFHPRAFALDVYFELNKDVDLFNADGTVITTLPKGSVVQLPPWAVVTTERDLLGKPITIQDTNKTIGQWVVGKKDFNKTVKTGLRLKKIYSNYDLTWSDKASDLQRQLVNHSKELNNLTDNNDDVYLDYEALIGSNSFSVVGTDRVEALIAQKPHDSENCSTSARGINPERSNAGKLQDYLLRNDGNYTDALKEKLESIKDNFLKTCVGSNDRKSGKAFERFIATLIAKTKEIGINPKLLISKIALESEGDCKVINRGSKHIKSSGAKGLFQLHRSSGKSSNGNPYHDLDKVIPLLEEEKLALISDKGFGPKILEKTPDKEELFIKAMAFSFNAGQGRTLTAIQYIRDYNLKRNPNEPEKDIFSWNDLTWALNKVYTSGGGKRAVQQGIPYAEGVSAVYPRVNSQTLSLNTDGGGLDFF